MVVQDRVISWHGGTGQGYQLAWWYMTGLSCSKEEHDRVIRRYQAASRYMTGLSCTKEIHDRVIMHQGDT